MDGWLFGGSGEEGGGFWMGGGAELWFFFEGGFLSLFFPLGYLSSVGEARVGWILGFWGSGFGSWGLVSRRLKGLFDSLVGSECCFLGIDRYIIYLDG